MNMRLALLVSLTLLAMTSIPVLATASTDPTLDSVTCIQNEGLGTEVGQCGTCTGADSETMEGCWGVEGNRVGTCSGGAFLLACFELR